MLTVFFHVYSIFSCLQCFFPVCSIFSCLQYFFMFAVFFAYVNTICQTFHSNRLLCYSLLDKDSVLDNFTPLVTKQFSQTFHSNRLLCYSLLDKDSVLDSFTTLVTKQFSQTLISLKEVSLLQVLGKSCLIKHC